MNFHRTFALLCICFFMIVSGCYTAKRSVVDLKPIDFNTNNSFYSKSDLPNFYAKAKESFNNRKYDEVI